MTPRDGLIAFHQTDKSKAMADHMAGHPSGLTKKQVSMMRHALGFQRGQRRSYRNRYFVHPANDDGRAWLELVGLGLAHCRPDSLDEVTGCYFFWLTQSGAEAARNRGESLCPEDFPKSKFKARPKA